MAVELYIFLYETCAAYAEAFDMPKRYDAFRSGKFGPDTHDKITGGIVSGLRDFECPICRQPEQNTIGRRALRLYLYELPFELIATHVTYLNRHVKRFICGY